MASVGTWANPLYAKSSLYTTETKSGGESQYASVITPINDNFYCISKTHLRIEVNTFVMVMIMVLNVHL